MLVLALGRGCPLLLIIILNIPDVGMPAIGYECPPFKSVALSFLQLITDFGISASANGCPLLQSVNLSFSGSGQCRTSKMQEYMMCS